MLVLVRNESDEDSCVAAFQIHVVTEDSRCEDAVLPLP